MSLDDRPHTEDEWVSLRAELAALTIDTGAEHVHRRALQILRRAEAGGQELIVIDALRIAGSATLELGNIDQALWLLGQACRRAELVPGDAGRSALGEALLERSFTAIRHGDLAAAIADGTHAAHHVDRRHRGRALLLLALAHQHLGDQPTSARFYDEALTAAQDAGDLVTVAKVVNNLALARAEAGELAEADALFERAAAEFAAAGDAAGLVRVRYNRSLNWSAMGRHALALATIAEVGPELRAMGVDEGILDLDRARALFRAGLVNQATAAAVSAAARLSTGAAGLEATEVLYELARASFIVDQRSRAAELGREAVAGFTQQGRERRRRSATALVAALAVLDGGAATDELEWLDPDLAVVAAGRLFERDRRRDAVGLLHRTAVPEPGAADDAYRHLNEALRALDDGRVDDRRRAVADGFEAVVASLRSLSNHEVCSSVLGRLTALVGVGMRAELDDGQTVAALDVVERWRQLLVTSASAVGADARTAGAHVRPARGPRPDHPAGGVTAISIVADRTNFLAFVVNDDGLELRRLGEVDAVCDAVLATRATLAHLSSSHRPSTAARLRLAGAVATLTRTIVDPIADLLVAQGRENPLVIVPDPRLADVPWAMLDELAAWSITVAPSLRLHTPAPSGLQSVLAVCGPGVPLAVTEAEAVATHCPGSRVLREGDASCVNVRAEAAGYDVLHLIGHGRFRDDDPLHSSVMLADGELIVASLHELEQLPELIVLSSCDLGRGGAARPDHLVGLVSALADRGCGALVAPIGPVRDEEMTRLMTLFYAHLSGGVAVDVALTRAQHDMRGEGAVSTDAVVHLHVPAHLS